VRGKRVILRPFREDEVDRLVAVAGAPPADDGIHWGPRDRDAILARVAASGTWKAGQLTFAVETDGRLVGEVQARSAPGAIPPGVFELGIEIHDDADRGRGLGSDAIAAITSHLFGQEEAIRVQISTDVDNAAMRRAAEKLGFGFEGVLRGFMPTRRGPLDYAMYGMTKDDWRTKRTRWTRTS
jgi:RimJ/RimL family protein N-acetyltransferase